ncbi:unnamed protein product [Didymodactylos carnosus]|uniref:Protein kinase domain-containing protein n=1 Tax=Didymodactylos carnosus TaxID=1234261 RepID=A0A813VD31_9BILA|nr:unnamed protein product [Didymodactylos carnosus]CAF0839225.1 unnamed protein product [Didymodactylos carnosus]CAF3526990.1 unnamed protein product [Didymodactylos carnosus]CAF3626518.1 unnamed protein product [Didymodactylos carnosus]
MYTMGGGNVEEQYYGAAAKVQKRYYTDQFSLHQSRLNEISVEAKEGKKSNDITRRDNDGCCDQDFDKKWSRREKSDLYMTTLNFKVIEKLGKGGFGVVYLARWYHNKRLLNLPPNGDLCALKVANKQQLIKKKAQTFVIRERDLLHCCNHPNLTKLLTSFKDEVNIYMVLEFIAGGDFFMYIRARDRIAEDHARFYVQQVILGFEYLHCCNILYRDLKPENIMLTGRGYIKLIDFGFAKQVLTKTATMCGTPQFMSPEIILQENYDRCIDWWALGILNYEMMAGESPFHGDSDEELFEAILKNPIRFKSTIFSNVAADFIKGLLTRNPKRRLGCTHEGMDAVKYHPWFKRGYSFEQILQQNKTAVYVPSTLKDYRNVPLKLIEVTKAQQLTNEDEFVDF